MSQNRQRHRYARYKALRNHVLALTPFTYTSRTLANERHPERNEDSILIDQATGLVAVFDGVGGSAAGEIASQTAARATCAGWRRILRRYQQGRRTLTMLEDSPDLNLSVVLQDLILESDELVRTEGATRAGTDDLATTVALAAFCREPETDSYVMVYAHVGDSRIYLLREQEQIRRLTSDDGLLAKLVENQIVHELDALRIDQAMQAHELSDIEFNYFRLRGGITQALGGPLPPTIHINRIDIKPGDRILLCTDGIHDNLIDQEIEQVIRNTPRTANARILVEHAIARSRQDRSVTIRAKPDDMSAVVVTYRF
ncbi:MAG: serine/threonine-protein phosphatase [Ktedonobacteraceae bacterium]|nr:serine/threonine-protein phosphatase [Ktedonobacteraceae bacterium]